MYNRLLVAGFCGLMMAACSSQKNDATTGMIEGTDGGDASADGDGAAGSTGGSTGGTAGADTGLDATVPGKSGLPLPQTTGVAKPAGSPGNLSVLDWAGFKAAISWTFDDAQPSQIAHYAELQAAGVPMTFYLSTGNSGLANFDATWTQAAKDGHELGNHTVHHCKSDLTGCSFGTAAADIGAELDQCSDYIVQHDGQSAVWTAASPFGDTGYDTPAQSRFLVNRGVGSGMIGPKDSTDPFNLPCHVAAEAETEDAFNAATDSAHAAGKWLIFLVHTINPTSDNWYNPVDISAVTGAMGHGKSAGDIWMDTVVNIAAYWRAQKMFASLTPTTSGTSQTWTWTLPDHFPSGKYLRVTVDGGTLSQGGNTLAWDDHGFYEVSLDAQTLTLAP